MKTRFPIITLVLISLGLLVSACAGGAGTTTSWPGLSVDLENELAYLAFGQNVYAVNLANGTEKWRAPAERENNITFFAPPSKTPDGQVIVGSYNNMLYSLNPENGQQNWTFEGAKSRYIAGALSTDEFIFAPSSDKNLYALDLSGNQVWSFTTEDALWATPVTDGDIVYQPGMDHRIYALNAQTGELIWKTDSLGGSIAGKPALNEAGVLFVGTFNQELLALDTAQNGAVVWRMPASAWVYAGPTLEGDSLFVGDLDGMFYAVEAATGAIRWKIQPDSNADRAITDNPLVIGDTVYFTSESGNLFAVESATGNPVWSKSIDGRLNAGPVAADDVILLAPEGTEELLIALDLNGNQKWLFVPAE